MLSEITGNRPAAALDNLNAAVEPLLASPGAGDAIGEVVLVLELVGEGSSSHDEASPRTLTDRNARAVLDMLPDAGSADGGRLVEQQRASQLVRTVAASGPRCSTRDADRDPAAPTAATGDDEVQQPSLTP